MNMCIDILFIFSATEDIYEKHTSRGMEISD